MLCVRQGHTSRIRGRRTLLMSWEAPIAVPSGNKNHFIGKILSLDFGFLEDDYVRLEKIEHCRKSALISPWLEAERVACICKHRDSTL